METKTVYVAYTNTDCTEGRGYDIPIAVCELEITAMKHARKMYVQGSNGPVKSMEVIKYNDKWYIPQSAVEIFKPTKEEIEAQKLLDEKRAIIKKMKELGVSQDEINLVMK